MFIYKEIKNEDGSLKDKVFLRQITVHPSFEGIGMYGAINFQKFKDLAKDLEPSSNSISVMAA